MAREPIGSMTYTTPFGKLIKVGTALKQFQPVLTVRAGPRDSSEKCVIINALFMKHFRKEVEQKGLEGASVTTFLEGKTLFLPFGITAVLAIILGSLVSAFLAKDPSTLAMWVVAYLVLVVGVFQICFGVCLQVLAAEGKRKFGFLSFFFYNLGNLLVIAGTIVKYEGGGTSLLVPIGGGAVLLSMLLMLFVVSHEKKSWLLGLFYITVGIIIVAVPVGIFLH